MSFSSSFTYSSTLGFILDRKILALSMAGVLKNLAPVFLGKLMFNYIAVTVKLTFKTILQKVMVS